MTMRVSERMSFYNHREFGDVCFLTIANCPYFSAFQYLWEEKFFLLLSSKLKSSNFEKFDGIREKQMIGSMHSLRSSYIFLNHIFHRITIHYKKKKKKKKACLHENIEKQFGTQAPCGSPFSIENVKVIPISLQWRVNRPKAHFSHVLKNISEMRRKFYKNNEKRRFILFAGDSKK